MLILKQWYTPFIPWPCPDNFCLFSSTVIVQFNSLSVRQQLKESVLNICKLFFPHWYRVLSIILFVLRFFENTGAEAVHLVFDLFLPVCILLGKVSVSLYEEVVLSFDDPSHFVSSGVPWNNKISGSAGYYFLFSLIHCRANILPNAQGIEHDITETAWVHFPFSLSDCCFVAWKKDLPPKNMHICFVLSH